MKKTCEKYEVLKGGGDCIYYDAEVYSLGTAEFCKFYHKLLYNLRDKNCPHRPVYSDEVVGIKVQTSTVCPEGKAILFPSDVLDENTGEIIPEKVAVINLE